MENDLNICPDHKERFLYVCMHCKRPICDKCGGHYGHEVVMSSRCEEECKYKLSDLKDMNILGKKIDEAIRNIENQITTNKGKYDDTVQKLRSVMEKLKGIGDGGQDLLYLGKLKESLNSIIRIAKTDTLRAELEFVNQHLNIEEKIKEEIIKLNESITTYNQNITEIVNETKSLNLNLRLLRSVKVSVSTGSLSDSTKTTLSILDNLKIINISCIQGDIINKKGPIHFDCYIPSKTTVLSAEKRKISDYIEISEPIPVDIGLKTNGKLFLTSLSKSGVLSIFTRGDGYNLQISDLNSGLRVELDVENDTNIAFYNDRAFFLTTSKCLRETKIPKLFSNSGTVELIPVPGNDGVCLRQAPSFHLVESTGMLYYIDNKNEICEYDIINKKNMKVPINRSTFTIAQTYDFDYGVKCIFFDNEDNNKIYALNNNNSITLLFQGNTSYIGGVFPCSEDPSNLSNAAFKLDASLFDGKSFVSPKPVINFEMAYSVVRYSDDIYLLFDDTRKSWVLSNIRVFKPKQQTMIEHPQTTIPKTPTLPKQPIIPKSPKSPKSLKSPKNTPHFEAFENIARLYSLKDVEEKTSRNVRGIEISEPVPFENNLITMGSNYITSISPNGVLAIYCLYEGGRHILQLTNLTAEKGNPNAQILLNMEGATSAAFYDEKVILLTRGRCMRLGLVSSLFMARDLSILGEITDFPVTEYAELSSVNTTRKLYYNPNNTLRCYNVDTREDKKILPQNNIGRIVSYCGHRFGIQAVFVTRKNKVRYLTGRNEIISLPLRSGNKNVLCVLPSKNEPNNIHKAIFKIGDMFVDSSRSIRIPSPVSFNKSLAIVRLYDDIYLLLNSTTNKWVLSKIIINQLSKPVKKQIMKYTAFNNADKVFEIERIKPNNIVQLKNGVKMSKCYAVNSCLNTNGTNFKLSISSNGLGIMYFFDEGHKIQIIDFNNNRQLVIPIEDITTACIYDSEVILLTRQQLLRHCKIENIITNMRITDVKTEGTEKLSSSADVSNIQRTKTIYYSTVRGNLYSYNVVNRYITRIQIAVEVTNISSLCSYDFGIDCVFNGKDNKLYALKNDTPRIINNNCMSAITNVIPCAEYLTILNQVLLIHNTGFLRYSKTFDAGELVNFSPSNSFVRVYNDYFILFDQKKLKWVLTRIIIGVPSKRVNPVPIPNPINIKNGPKGPIRSGQPSNSIIIASQAKYNNSDLTVINSQEDETVLTTKNGETLSRGPLGILPPLILDSDDSGSSDSRKKDVSNSDDQHHGPVHPKVDYERSWMNFDGTFKGTNPSNGLSPNMENKRDGKYTEGIEDVDSSEEEESESTSESSEGENEDSSGSSTNEFSSDFSSTGQDSSSSETE